MSTPAPGMRTLIAIALLALCGCASPPPARSGIDSPHARIVHVVIDGGHTGIAVRAADVPRAAWPARADFPDAEHLELGWGEREYYTREGNTVWLALRALFWSEASALHAVGFDGPVERAFPGAEVLRLALTPDGFERMVAFVAASHERDPSGGAIVLGPGQRPRSLFYASPRRFHVLETCNTWVARALREAGVPVEPLGAFTAMGLMRQLRPLAVRQPVVNCGVCPNELQAFLSPWSPAPRAASASPSPSGSSRTAIARR